MKGASIAQIVQVALLQEIPLNGLAGIYELVNAAQFRTPKLKDDIPNPCNGC